MNKTCTCHSAPVHAPAQHSHCTSASVPTIVLTLALALRPPVLMFHLWHTLRIALMLHCQRTHTLAHTDACTHTRARARARARVCARAHTPTRTHARTHTHNARLHTCTHAPHAHGHTPLPPRHRQFNSAPSSPPPSPPPTA
eukprot:8821906-Lingulodinium_polyedra.AAC.1